MSLGTGALKVGRGTEHFRPRQGGIHGNHVSRNHPCRQLPTGTITLRPDQWKNTYLTTILTKWFETSERKGGLGAWIHKDSLKHRQNDLLRSAREQAKCYASEGEVPSLCNHPASCHVCFRRNPLTSVRHRPSASIGSFLTLPKLHLATFNMKNKGNT